MIKHLHRLVRRLREQLTGGRSAKGYFRLVAVDELTGLRTPLSAWRPNLILYGWGTIVANLLATGNEAYKIGAMYLEYENLSDPDDTIAVPSFDRSGGKSYYDSLDLSGTKDYLRVPIRFTAIESSNVLLFPGGNVLTFSATSSGSTGTHGRAFGAVSNSKLYGGAVVATPDFSDATQDIVFSRFYLSLSDQQLKSSNQQLSLEYALTLN